MKRLITFLHRNYGRSVMTLLLLFSVLSGTWANNFIHLWENEGQGTFYDMGTNNTCTIKGLKANTRYGVLIVNKNSWDNATKWGASSDNKSNPSAIPCSQFFGSDKDFYFTTGAAGEYTFTADWNNGKPTLSISLYKATEESKYYLIVPNANVGNTNRYVSDDEFKAPAGHRAFRLRASRERNSDVINNDLTTVALKLDGRQLRYNSNKEIEFYIQSNDGTVYMQPKANNDDDTYIKLARNSNNLAKNGVDYYATRTGISTSNQNRYYKIHKDDTNPSDGTIDAKTLVFMFSKNNASKTTVENNTTINIPNGNVINGEREDTNYKNGRNGNLIVGFLMSRGAGSTYYKEHIKENGVYLVGSIAQDAYTHDMNYPMEKRYWKDGRIVELSELGNNEAKADSIVYNCLVKNKDRSWGKFYLSFSTGDVVMKKKDKDDSKYALWNLLLRPCVQAYMDAQELGGGVSFYKYDDGDDNSQQSINPLLTEEQKKRYVSYRVYFNATYSTYRIEFNDELYIAGPAVATKKVWEKLSDDEKNAKNSGTCFNEANRYAMKKTTVKGLGDHYTYMGYFRQGHYFAFLVNETTTSSNYSEDENALTNDNVKSVWNVQAPTDVKGGDYAYYNRVKWNNGNGGTDSQSLGSGNNGILWTLPDGYYTVRFYYGGINGPEDGKTALYTVDKNVKISNITVEVNSEEKNYNGWNAFSDDCALLMPENIKAYYAYGVEEKNGMNVVQLRELKGGYIPANCGVLLRNENLTEKGDVESLNYMPIPADYTKNFEDYNTEQKINDVNLLMDCSTTDKLKGLSQNDGKYYNYFFTYIYKDDSKNNGATFNVPLNFWKVYPGETPIKNTSYLQVDKQITPLAFNTTDNNYYITDGETVANAKGAYCLLFSIDDVDDSEVTGIRVIRPAAGNNANADVWYNMQGMRVAKPTTAGIYINNGKKVIIK